MTAQVAADLRAAAEVLRRDGWTQGAMYREGRCCAVGAIHKATHGLGALDARVVLADHLGQSPALWNDAPNRTADEVIAALEAAADAAEVQP